MIFNQVSPCKIHAPLTALFHKSRGLDELHFVNIGDTDHNITLL